MCVCLSLLWQTDIGVSVSACNATPGYEKASEEEPTSCAAQHRRPKHLKHLKHYFNIENRAICLDTYRKNQKSKPT